MKKKLLVLFTLCCLSLVGCSSKSDGNIKPVDIAKPLQGCMPDEAGMHVVALRDDGSEMCIDIVTPDGSFSAAVIVSSHDYGSYEDYLEDISTGKEFREGYFILYEDSNIVSLESRKYNMTMALNYKSDYEDYVNKFIDIMNTINGNVSLDSKDWEDVKSIIKE